MLCSVERILAYTTAYEAEKPAIIPHKRPPADWPSQGQITLDNLVVKYRPDLPPVLKGLSLSIKAGEKVRLQLEAWVLVPLPAVCQHPMDVKGAQLLSTTFHSCLLRCQIGVAGRTGGGKSTLMMVRVALYILRVEGV